MTRTYSYACCFYAHGLCTGTATYPATRQGTREKCQCQCHSSREDYVKMT